MLESASREAATADARAIVDGVPADVLPHAHHETRARRFLDAIAAGRRTRGAALLGVVNITPDSFSDGGRYLDRDRAIAHARELVAAGASLVDVGAESTKPGAAPVPESEQLRRALPVVEALAPEMAITIDTTSGVVARACLEAGAVAVNDVSGGVDVCLAQAAAELNAGYILSHARRGQSTMAGFGAWPEDAYREVVGEVRKELRDARARLVAAGVLDEAIVLDPGLGFTKSYMQSARLLAATAQLVSDGPVLIGASRKSFLTLAARAAGPDDRLAASLSAALWARREGASIVRVHDVAATVQAFAMDQVLEEARAHA